MRYFGPKSLSSVMAKALKVLWVLALLATILAPFAGTAVIYFSTPQGEAFLEKVKTGASSCIKPGDLDGADLSAKDKADWAKFKAVPLPLKLLMLPYGMAVLLLLLTVLSRARRLFESFRDDRVFRQENVALMKNLAKLLIAYGVLTFSFNTLLIAVILLMACEVIKNGAVLQEEHDLTV